MTSLFGIALTILQLFDLHYGKPLIPTLSLALPSVRLGLYRWLTMAEQRTNNRHCQPEPDICAPSVAYFESAC